MHDQWSSYNKSVPDVDKWPFLWKLLQNVSKQLGCLCQCYIEFQPVKKKIEFSSGLKLDNVACYLATDSFPFMFQVSLTPKGTLGYESQYAIIQTKAPEVTDREAAKSRPQVLGSLSELLAAFSEQETKARPRPSFNPIVSSESQVSHFRRGSQLKAINANRRCTAKSLRNCPDNFCRFLMTPLN